MVVLGPRIRVVYLGGRTVEGRVRRFDPVLPDFTMDAVELGASRIAFADVRWVAFLEDADGDGGRVGQSTGREVTLRLYDLAEIHGYLLAAAQPGRGVLLAPQEQGVERVYVPLAALRDVVSVKPLGVILIEESGVPATAVEEALRRQREMKEAPLGKILLDRGQVSQPQLERGLDAQRRRPGQRIGQVLVELGFIDQGAVDAALEVQRLLRGRRLGDLLTEMGLVDQRTVYVALAIQHHMPFFDDVGRELDPQALAVLPAAFARRWQVLPLRRDPELVTVAVSEAGNVALRDELRRILRVAIQDVLVVPDQLAEEIAVAYPPETARRGPPPEVP